MIQILIDDKCLREFTDKDLYPVVELITPGSKELKIVSNHPTADPQTLTIKVHEGSILHLKQCDVDFELQVINGAIFTIADSIDRGAVTFWELECLGVGPLDVSLLLI